MSFGGSVSSKAEFLGVTQTDRQTDRQTDSMVVSSREPPVSVKEYSYAERVLIEQC